MSRLAVLSLLGAIGLAASACGGGATASFVASLDADDDDAKSLGFETESIPG